MKSTLKLALSIASIELRKALAYRTDFWVSFIFGTISRVGLAYFLWKSIFEFAQQKNIGGFTFQQMLLYSALSYFVDQLVRSSTLKTSSLAREIYDGTLTRYLLYPVRIFPFKFSIAFTHVFVGFLQLLLGLVVYTLLFGWPEAPALQGFAFVGCLLICIPAMLCFFLMVYLIELIAFWADNVWSLNVMLKFISAFLGGAFLPLDLFPDTVKTFLWYLPFYHIIGVPTNLLMGRLGLETVLPSILILGLWSVILFSIVRILWSRGVKRFSGVGI